MAIWGEIIVGIVIVIGIVGVIVPILPGVILIFGAFLVWAIVEGGAAAWISFAIATVVLVVTGVVKYLWPGKNLKAAGIPNRSLLIGGLLGIVGFFVIPVIGLFVGFILGMYASELQRLQTHQRAWPATVEATKAVGLSMLIELLGALLAAGIWVGAVFVA